MRRADDLSTFWPIAGLLAVVQVLKRRHGGVSPAEDEEQKGEQKRCDHEGQESSLTITVRRFDS
jgi:hypothetical protein